ncbi:MAG: ATP phosphoribosyltransferase regulatory subunit [Nevskiaceae bacterium]|nr:MAG: ATP phosphoribosyltransferase regulatory subunit [Nevskiaceae bacterium]TBR74633.1 MAG: ATP phosphoribosyltransferase regulatory subunit [Nevskiaceae bacterium]
MRNSSGTTDARLWMLPDGVEEWLPDMAWALEELRVRLLQCYRRRGFALVIPPPIEHLEALLTGAGGELEAQTFKCTDPVSGRLLGLRADMTPQAARIAARHFRDLAVVRLCYLGSVLRARADAPGGPRAPMQVGCEIFGDTRLDADLEVLELMLATLELAELHDIHVGLGHAAIYHALLESTALNATAQVELFGILQRKSVPDFAAFCAEQALEPQLRSQLAALLQLHGDVTVLAEARQRLSGISPAVDAALGDLEQVVAVLAKQAPGVCLHVDLAELRGYGYHTGIVFSAFASGHGSELARGGRYDGAGREFGLARPATGFSADINELLRLGHGAAA